MAIQISKSMVARLPEAERVDIENKLWEKSAGVCFLCEELLHRASENIEADHDVPEEEGGLTILSNLNLVHVECNRAKRNAKTVPIRPYLKLKAFIRKHGPRQRYDGFLAHFEIAPQLTVLDHIDDDHVRFDLADGSTRTCDVHVEKNLAGDFHYAYVDLPRVSIFNDNDVQPRTIRETHVWSIYSDLQVNPLHEPPGCRVEKAGGGVRLLMFDGQHKTVANWMMDRPRIVAKVYLDLNKEQANRLVNSIQSRIPKLPLSPFELAAKMEQEWRARLDEYETQVGADEASEAGFFKWLPQAERLRGRAAFKEALIQSQLGNPDLRIRDFVRNPGMKAPDDGLFLNEPTMKSKVLGRLVKFDPLTLKGEDFVTYRALESENIGFLLNTFTDAALLPREGEPKLTAAQLIAAKRLIYQSALQYSTDLLMKAFLHNTLGDSLGAARPDDAQRAKFEQQVRRLVAHPVWTADYARDEKMVAVRNALEKNQEAKKSFEDVGLDLAYMVVGEESAAFKRYWRS